MNFVHFPTKMTCNNEQLRLVRPSRPQHRTATPQQHRLLHSSQVTQPSPNLSMYVFREPRGAGTARIAKSWHDGRSSPLIARHRAEPIHTNPRLNKDTRPSGRTHTASRNAAMDKIETLTGHFCKQYSLLFDYRLSNSAFNFFFYFTNLKFSTVTTTGRFLGVVGHNQRHRRSLSPRFTKSCRRQLQSRTRYWWSAGRNFVVLFFGKSKSRKMFSCESNFPKDID